SWPIGIINVILFFFLFYQVQLYPDMFLQVFFFVTNLLGWWRWANPRKGEEDKKNELRVSWMPEKAWLLFSFLLIVGTTVFGSLAGRLHEFFPTVFPLPSAFPYLDSFVTVASIVATYLMTQKKVECWIVWILTDIVATYLYFSKGILFVGAEYAAFCGIAAFGFWKWRTEYKSYSL
ncbi:MAG: nicotinamide riboside transporter PnuC, partial [Cyclobacteriaceae bacterium]|nr:nicotinamide riboside transporter PnuC [Cyclobacteriaceae bacterium]